MFYRWCFHMLNLFPLPKSWKITWKIISFKKWLGSHPLISVMGSHNPRNWGRRLTMAIVPQMVASQNPSQPWILWNSIWYSKARACCHCPLLPHALTTAPLQTWEIPKKKKHGEINNIGSLGVVLGNRIQPETSKKKTNPSSLGWCFEQCLTCRIYESCFALLPWKSQHH